MTDPGFKFSHYSINRCLYNMNSVGKRKRWKVGYRNNVPSISTTMHSPQTLQDDSKVQNESFDPFLYRDIKYFFHQNTNISSKRKINCQLSVIITFRTIMSGSPSKVDFDKNQRELVPNIKNLRLKGGEKLLWCFGPGIV